MTNSPITFARIIAVVPLLLVLRGISAAPPDFALSGLAPEDTNLLVSIREATPEDADWTKAIAQRAGVIIAAGDMEHWNKVKSFCAGLSGAPKSGCSPESLLAIRFGHPAIPEDWVLATRITDTELCAAGLRAAGARVMGSGAFSLADAGLELRSCGRWLLASSMNSPLAEEIQERAMVDSTSSTDPLVRDVVASLPRGAMEILFRHDTPASGITAACFQPSSAREAKILLSGRYASSPLPSRTSSKLDLRMVPRLAGDSSMVIRESGVGLLDPILLRFGATVPVVVPPAFLRKHLASERLLVLDGETLELDGGEMTVAPVACVAVPLLLEGQDEAAVNDAFDAWMRDVGRALKVMIASDPEASSEDSDDVSVEVGVQSIDFGPELARALGGHPIGHATSLNWLSCTEQGGRQWLLISTSPLLAGKVGAALRSLVGEDGAQESCTGGAVRPEALAAQVLELSSIRSRDEDPNSISDAKLLSSIAAILAGVEEVEWNFTRQDEEAVEGWVQIRLPMPLSEEDLP